MFSKIVLLTSNNPKPANNATLRERRVIHDLLPSYGLIYTRNGFISAEYSNIPL